ncbi:MAG: hypothetical protein GY778_12880 [bacterium]|nr:hypothetical protein [bacterium]
MPPGWAEQIAFEQATEESAADSNGAAVPGLPIVSPDGIDPHWAGGFDDTKSDGLDDAPFIAAAHRPKYAGRSALDPWMRSATSKAAPRRRGDYTVMIIVFAAPLILLIPLAWVWHLMHVLWPCRFDRRTHARFADAR